MARDYAAVPHEYLEEMQMLSDVEFGRLMRALLNYSRTGEPMALHGNEKFYVQRVMAEEDRHRRSYEELAGAKSRAGKASALARQQRSAALNSVQRRSTLFNGDELCSTAFDGAQHTNDTNTDTETDLDSETKTETKTETETKPYTERVCSAGSVFDFPDDTRALSERTVYASPLPERRKRWRY